MKINQHPLLRNIFGLLLISFFPALTLGGEPKVKKQDPTIFFWYHFRTAVIQNNLPKLKELTRFPFETTDANGTITKTPRGSFANLFHPLLETPVKNKKTMREIITAKEDLTTEERAALKEGKIQIGSFRFQTIKNVCYFIGASLAPEPPAAKKTAVAVPLAAVPARVEKTIPPPPAPSPTTSPDFDKSDEEPPQNLAASPPKEKSTEKTPTESLEKNVPAVTEADDSALSPVFRFYWVAFRQAALNNDVEKVKSLTKFPFVTKGPLEEDKKKKYVAKEFDLLWPRLLESDPHSWGPLRDSMKELIERREEPSVEEITTEPTGEVQVGIFIFRKTKSRWFFTQAILSE